MNKSNVKKKDKSIDKSLAGWETAIREARRGITGARLKIKELNKAIAVFKSNLRREEPWPG
ncbi:MAG: hypothetical protein A3F68_07005 [Acidobacteria bacterium RIFCSPLOWO2_12_FULL_54_10]|nr:MAG: hypothetical protein A3F68_07005 [Acidobacteria bacterium RIFCSPLOWO2_12_FULL_54_10]